MKNEKSKTTSCNKIRSRLFMYLNNSGILREDNRQEIEEHLTSCEHCRKLAEMMRREGLGGKLMSCC